VADDVIEVDIRGTDRIPVRPTSVDVIREAERRHLQDIVNAGGSEYERFSVEEMQRALAGGPPQETVTQRELELSGVLEPADRMRSFFEEIGMSGAHRPAEKSEAPADVRARIGISSSAIIRGAQEGTHRQRNSIELVNRQTQQPIGRFRVGDYVPGFGSIDDIDLRLVQRPGQPEIEVPSVRIVPDDETLGPYWLQGDDLAPPGTEDILAQRMSYFEPTNERRWDERRSRAMDFEEAFGRLGNLADITGPFETPAITSLDAGDEMRRQANKETADAGYEVPAWQSDLDQGLLAEEQETADDELLQDLMGLEAGSPEEAALRSMRGEGGGTTGVEDVYGVSMDGEDFVAVDTAEGTYYYNSDTGENFWEYGGS